MGRSITDTPAVAGSPHIVAGRYRIERPLGSGFLGESYLVQAVQPGAAPQYEVLKLLHPERDAATPPSRIATLAACAHPNLAPPFDSGVDEQSGRRFVVTHWLDGVDWVSAARLAGPQETPYLLAPVCRALAYLHERGLSHGRLHSGNIRVLRPADGRAPRVIVCDFGLATADSKQGHGEDFSSLGWMILRGLVPEPILPPGDELPPGDLEAIVRAHGDPASPALAYVVRRCLGLDSEPPFRSPIEVLDEVNRRAGLDLAIQAPELRQALEFNVRMVGRQRELDRLKMRLEALTGGSLGVPIAPLAVLIGEAGVGKSRLLRELLSQAGKKKLKLASGGCRESARHPYAALEEVVKTLAASLEARREQEKIPSGEPHPLVARYGRELVKICPEIGKPHGIAASEPLEPEQEKMRLIDQTAYFVHDSSRQAPILLTVEDLHWADEGTLDLLRYLCRMGQGGSVQVVATARREEMGESLLKRFIDEGSGDGWLEQIPLQSLGETELRSLAAEVLELKDPAAASALEKICRDAEGNPYQLQEILCHLMEEGVLRSLQGRWEIDMGRLDSVPIPAKIAEAFLGRIRRLDPPSVQLLQMLATFGRAASVDQLARMLERPRWEVQRRVEALTDRAILDRLPSGDDHLYTFHHARQAEVLYNSLKEHECQSLHAMVSNELKGSTATYDPSHQAELSRHLLRANLVQEAFHTGVKAMEGLIRQNAHREAYALATSLREHLRAVPELGPLFLNLLGESVMKLREPHRAITIYEQALVEARKLGQDREAAISLMGVTWGCFWDHDPRVTARGILAARQAYVILCRLQDIPLTVSLLCKWAGYFLGAKKLKIAERMIEKAQSLVHEDLRKADWIRILPDKAILLALRGRYKDAAALMQRALRMAEAERDVFSVILNLVNLSYLAHACGDYRLALSYLSRQEVDCGRGKESLASAHVDLQRGISLIGRARLAEAAATLQEQNRRRDSTLQLGVRVSLKLSLIDALLYLGRGQEAQALIAEIEGSGAHELSVEQEIVLQIAKVRLAKAMGNVQEARGSAQLVIADAREREHRRLEAKAIQQFLLLDRAGWIHAESAAMEERVLEIASDGESIEESIVASVVRAKRAFRFHLPGEARVFLDEAYTLAEGREARIWSMRVLREQTALAAAVGDGMYASTVETLRKERIQEILDSIDDAAHKEAFLRSELAEGWEETRSRPFGNEDRPETGGAGDGSTGMRVWTPRGRSSTQVPDQIEGQEDALIVGRSAELKRVLSKVAIAAKGDLSVLVQGESGTGKELVARRIHELSSRSAMPFVAADCGAIPENLIESELFGYRRGAFTGADRDKPGLLEEVSGGTLLLDEIGNAGANFQAKLLRVLQEREVRRIGENRTRPIDVRIVAATNLKLRKAVEQGSFREDLFYRLSVIMIEVPPLRDRKDDIPILSRAFLLDMQKQGQKVGSLSSDALEVMGAYSWPGNIRELRNALQAAALAADGSTITRVHLPDALRESRMLSTAEAHEPPAAGLTMDDSEKRRLEQALLEARGVRSAACTLLGWNRMKLYRRMKLHQIPADFGKPPKE